MTNETQFLISQLKLINDKQIVDNIIGEIDAQRNTCKMIASENYASEAVQAAQAAFSLADKYSEGIPFHRYYGGCERVDEIEQACAEEACKLFGAEHAYVQPHSGIDANLTAYQAILDHRVTEPFLKEKGFKSRGDLPQNLFKELRSLLNSQKLLAPSLNNGGHLSHGSQQNISSQMFEVISYEQQFDKEEDYQLLEEQAIECKPLIILAGYSANVNKINYRKIRKIADKVNATLMVDMSHFAGLVAGKVFTGDYDPVKWADVVTTTTHKTLRGPRGGVVLCKEEFVKSVDKGCPLILGGPIQNIIAAKLVAFREAQTEEFKEYAQNIIKNRQALEDSLCAEHIEFPHSENHMILINVHKNFGISGRQAELALQECGIICNRNAIPNDPLGSWYTSGIRLGVPALTSRGLKEEDFKELGRIISFILSNIVVEKPNSIKYSFVNDASDDDFSMGLKKIFAFKIRADVKNILDRYPLYPNIDLNFVKEEVKNWEG